jgi:hypothetical protein
LIYLIFASSLLRFFSSSFLYFFISSFLRLSPTKMTNLWWWLCVNIWIRFINFINFINLINSLILISHTDEFLNFSFDENILVSVIL